MRIINTTIGIIVLIILQACSTQPTQSQTTPVETEKNNATKTHLVSTDKKFSTPEVQIIRELYQSWLFY